jgi:hypothetical protein
MLTCSGMIWNYDKISKWNTKASKIYAFVKCTFLQIWLLEKRNLGQLWIEYIYI